MSGKSSSLIFTNLHGSDLAAIRDRILHIANVHHATLTSWLPLPSFGRAVASFSSTSDAASVRAACDGLDLSGPSAGRFPQATTSAVRVYFADPVPAPLADSYLALPDAGKLFFISPPPSPPNGWEMRLEDAPNKLVHAQDLVEALSRLHGLSQSNPVHPALPPSTGHVSPPGNFDLSGDQHRPGDRSRSASILIYTPDLHAFPDVPDRPAISVEDTANYDLHSNMCAPFSSATKAHTARPPLEEVTL